jgi:hypothetical protein
LNVNRKIPVSFQKLEKFEIQADDTRFLPVKIWLMHLGENFNGSYFSKEVVESAIPSLANTPILSYIEDNSDDELDFSDHRQVLVVKNDSFDLKYLGQAIGIIPESNNAQFEDRLCEDNVTRTFLTVEGLIWTKWDEPVDILNRDLFKAQSMELHSDYEGVYNEEDNMFHFSKFKFFGACGLGKDVLPAMINSTIEVNFNLDMFKQEIQDKMEQFKLALSNNDDRGGTKMNEKLELLGQFSKLGEDVLEKVKESLESYSLEDLENKLFQMSESTPREEEPVVFTLTSEQLEEELKRELYEIEAIQEQYYDETYSYPRYSLVDSMPEQSIVVAYDCKENILVGFGYQLINENVEIDASSAVRYKVEFVPMNLAGDPDIEMDDKFSKHFTSLSQVDHKVKLKEKELNKQFQTEKESAQEVLEKATSDFAKLQEDYTKLEDSAKELEQFKLSHVQKEREKVENELFTNFINGFGLTDDDLSPIKEKKDSYSIEELEEKLFALAGRKKLSFSKTQEVKPIRYTLPVDNKPSNNKEWADLVEQHKNK